MFADWYIPILSSTPPQHIQLSGCPTRFKLPFDVVALRYVGARGLARERAGIGVLPGTHPTRQGLGCRVFSAGGAPEWAPVHEGFATLPCSAGVWYFFMFAAEGPELRRSEMNGSR